jgi:hypothetical protein
MQGIRIASGSERLSFDEDALRVTWSYWKDNGQGQLDRFSDIVTKEDDSIFYANFTISKNMLNDGKDYDFPKNDGPVIMFVTSEAKVTDNKYIPSYKSKVFLYACQFKDDCSSIKSLRNEVKDRGICHADGKAGKNRLRITVSH